LAGALPALALPGFTLPGFTLPGLISGDRGVVGGETMGGAIGGDAAIAAVVPSRATMKLVLHLGQRIFIPLSGMRRSSTSYGDLHETHSTLIMCLRSGLRDKTLRAYTKAQRELDRTRE
jgi:hypothetical protein